MNDSVLDSIIPIEHPDETEYGLQYIPAQQGIDVAEGRAKALDRTGVESLKIMACDIREGMEVMDKNSGFAITQLITST